jgi:hypothetical protein
VTNISESIKGEAFIFGLIISKMRITTLLYLSLFNLICLVYAQEFEDAAFQPSGRSEITSADEDEGITMSTSDDFGSTENDDITMSEDIALNAIQDSGLGCVLQPDETNLLIRALSRCKSKACRKAAKKCQSIAEAKEVIESGLTITGGVAALVGSFALMPATYCLSALYVPHALTEVIEGCAEFRHAWKELQERRKARSVHPLIQFTDIAVESGSCELRREQYDELKRLSSQCSACSSQESFVTAPEDEEEWEERLEDAANRHEYAREHKPSRFRRMRKSLVKKGKKMCKRLHIEDPAKREAAKAGLKLVSGVSLIAGGAALAPLTNCFSIGAAAYGGIVFTKGCKQMFNAWRIFQIQRLEQILQAKLDEINVAYTSLDHGLRYAVQNLDQLTKKNSWRNKAVSDIVSKMQPLSETEIAIMDSVIKSCEKEPTCLRRVGKKIRAKVCHEGTYLHKISPEITDLGNAAAAFGEMAVTFESKGPFVLGHGVSAVKQTTYACSRIATKTVSHISYKLDKNRSKEEEEPSEDLTTA